MTFSKRGYQTFSGGYKEVEIEYAKQAVEHICREIYLEDALWERNITPLSELGDHRNPGSGKGSGRDSVRGEDGCLSLPE